MQWTPSIRAERTGDYRDTFIMCALCEDVLSEFSCYVLVTVFVPQACHRVSESRGRANPGTHYSDTPRPDAYYLYTQDGHDNT